MKNASVVLTFTCLLLACDHGVTQPRVVPETPTEQTPLSLDGGPKYELAQNQDETCCGDMELLTPLEKKILGVAKTCDRAKKKYVDEDLLVDLILMERSFGVPENLRGMLLASACTESGYNPNAEGDHKFSKRGKPKAIGLLQLWYWWTLPVEKGGYAVDRRDPLANAHAWMSHIKKMYPKVKKKCRISKKHVSRIWRVAWVTAIRAPKPEGRCNEFPNHYRRLKKWKKQWRNLL